MDAKKSELTKFMSSEAQYYVPIYQRRYSWKKEHCLKLLLDIIKASKDSNRPCHFLGSVIYLAKDNAQHASAVKEYLVIDGQQRLTTLSLLLLALGDYTRFFIKSDDEYGKSVTNLDKLMRKYLVNEDESDDLYYKIRLNIEDFRAYKSLINNRKLPDGVKTSKIYTNYSSLLAEMQNLKIAPQIIFDGIKKLLLVDICLVPEDNAQLVFETVNTTGMQLSTADKIRNFLLMSMPPSRQTQLFNDYWHPMEEDLDMDSADSKTFEEFFYYYMTSVTKKQITGDYYEKFKDYYTENSSLGTEEIIKQIRQYSKLFKRWREADKLPGRIEQALSKVRATGQFKTTPAILKLLADNENGMITDEDVIEVLTIMEAYWMRRKVCNLPTNTAGPVCLSMLKCLYENNKIMAFKNNIKDLTWAQRMPEDWEMENILLKLPIYDINSGTTKMILDRLENHKRKEYVPTVEYTIEHIMPQTLNQDWKTDLGIEADIIHDIYLHTLGNLTLTGYNSEYQNKCFVEKKECQDREGNYIGYKHTPIKISHSLADLNQWNEAEITKRCKSLVAILNQIWKYPV